MKDLNYEVIITELKKLFSNIRDIKIYEINGNIRSTKGFIKINRDKQEVINKVIKENITYKNKHKNYISEIFLTDFQDKDVENKILEISYENSYLKNEILKRIITILITALISFVFMIKFLNTFFNIQVKNSVDKLLWLLAILVFLDINFIENESKFRNSMITILLSILPTILVILYKEIRKQYNYLEKYLTYDKITKLPTRYNLEREIEYLFHSKKEYILITLKLKNLADILSIAGYNDFVFKSISNFIIEKNKNMKIFNSYTTNYEILIEKNNDLNLDIYIKNLLDYLKNDLLEIKGTYFLLDIAMGIYCNDNSNDYNNTIKHGYEALDYACRKNKEYQVYSLEVKKYMQIIYLASKLEECIANNEFYIEYQPKYNIIEEKIFGCEALIRWTNKEFGFIPPGEFIPYLEKNNKITILTKWVFSQVLKDIKEFNKNTNLSFSINVCPVDLNSKGFVSFISDELKKYNVNSNRIELEITEGDLIKEVENSSKILSELRKLGIKIAIDDFGTGYSSLSYLNTLPVDQVKIDKSFTDKLLKETDKKSLLKHVIKLCHELKKEVIIEGVENKETLDLLKKIRCNKIQGYYISRPISKEKFKILSENKSPSGIVYN